MLLLRKKLSRKAEENSDSEEELHVAVPSENSSEEDEDEDDGLDCGPQSVSDRGSESESGLRHVQVQHYEEHKEYEEHDQDTRLEEQKALQKKYKKKPYAVSIELQKTKFDPTRLQTRHVEAKKKLASSWSAIIDKYSKYDLEQQGDIVDLANMAILKDTGHLKAMNTAGRLSVWDSAPDDDPVHEDQSRDPIMLLEDQSPSKKLKISPLKGGPWVDWVDSSPNHSESSCSREDSPVKVKQTLGDDPFYDGSYKSRRTSPLKSAKVNVNVNGSIHKPPAQPPKSKQPDPFNLLSPVKRTRRLDKESDPLDLLSLV